MKDGDNAMSAGNQQETISYVLGFVDAEGCFSVSLKKQKTTRFGWVLDPVFHVTQHENSREILELIKNNLKCGRIIEKHGQKETLQFLVDNRKQLFEKVIPFFDRNKLLVKGNDYLLFKRIVEGLERKEHSKPKPFAELAKLAFQMNMKGKQRRHKLNEVLNDLVGSSETVR
jgi:hypothetical protein